MDIEERLERLHEHVANHPHDYGNKEMKNVDSETGMAEDMLRSIVQLGATEMHYQTLYNKSVAQLENGLIEVEKDEVREKQLDKINRYREEINDVADVRRKMMRKLFSLFDGGNKDAWCLIKHAML